LLLYTDGLIEGRAARDSPQRLGFERVLSELRAQVHRGTHGAELLDAIVDYATRAHGAPLPDDVAAVLLTLH
jgi:serine phosphatase RsbU (regulator of sigma subunit)